MTVVPFVKSTLAAGPTRLECICVGGDLTVGTLLAHIVYRCAQPDVYWIAQTRQQWMAETGLTLEQYKRAISVLKQKQLVVVKIMKNQGITMTHVRVVPNTPSGWCETHQPDTSVIYNSTVSKEVSTVFRVPTSGASTTTGNENKSTTEDEEKEKEIGSVQSVGSEETKQSLGMVAKGWLMKATEILKHRQTPISTSLEAFWKSQMALVHGGFQMHVTAREAGQLKYLAKRLGDKTKPVIAYAIEHWVTFASQAGAAAGTGFPVEPHIGFLLKHHGVAVNLLYPVTQPPLPQKTLITTETPVHTSAPHPGATDPVHVLTAQELTALLDEFTSP